MRFDLQRLQPRPPKEMEVEFIELGAHRYPGLVVDNFYRDPDHVREFALALHYVHSRKYPGSRAALVSLSLDSIVSALYEPIGHRYFASPAAMEEAGTSAHFIRLEQPARTPQPDTHLLTAAVRLDQPTQCRGSWSFFRHRETGADALFSKALMKRRCPDGRSRSQWFPDESVRDRLWRHGAHLPYDQALEAGLVRDYDDYHDRITGTAGSDDGRAWELTHTVEMKVNRLVVLPGFLLHAAGLQPMQAGAAPGTGCLVQRFGFNWPAVPVSA